LAKSILIDDAKSIVLDQLAGGAKVRDAMRKVNRSEETYRSWRKEDPNFKSAVDAIREAHESGQRAKSALPDFPEFCAKYLDRPLPEHHVRAWDVVQGKDPTDLHYSMQYQPGKSPGRYMMMNFPPEHAKSTVWNVQYVLWRIIKDPNIQIITISKSQDMAKKFLRQLKFYLENPSLFPALHAAFAPEGGWKNEDKSAGLAWREDMIYIRGRTVSAKDPTVEAKGLGGQIYGARADLIILDDIADFKSASDYEKQADWIGQDVFSRLNKKNGQLLILGTRVGAMDVYRWLRDESKDAAGRPFYTYFAQPAILENESAPCDEWVVLWPDHVPAGALEDAKSAMTDQRRFTFVYQQRDVSEYAVFPAVAVDAAVNAKRFSCPMQPGVPGHRENGMDGLYVIASWDPASSAGRNAMICYGVDRFTKKRWVIDVWNRKGVTSAQSIPQLKAWQVKYHVNEWRIEKNAVQQFITQLPEIRQFVNANGGKIVEHETRQNKWDPVKGIEGLLVPLFLSCVLEVGDRMTPKPDGSGLIELPSKRQNPHVVELCEQLKAWEAEAKRLVQDLVMALWFAELGARDYLRGALGEKTHMESRWTSRGDKRSRTVVPWEELHRQGLVHAV
jgi:hypothetical protein